MGWPDIRNTTRSADSDCEGLGRAVDAASCPIEGADRASKRVIEIRAERIIMDFSSYWNTRVELSNDASSLSSCEPLYIDFAGKKKCRRDGPLGDFDGSLL